MAPFQNAPAPVASPTPVDFGIQVDQRKLGDFNLKANSESFDIFMEAMLGLTVQPQLLGPVTNVHTRVSYWTDKLSSHALDRLADLHDLLVDYQKNGYTYSSDTWNSQLRCLGLGNMTSDEPCYKRVDKSTLFDQDRSGSLRHKDSNIMDHLIFNVAKGRAEGFLSEIDRWTTRATSYDPEVAQFFHDCSKDSNTTVRSAARELARAMDDLFKKYGRSRGNAMEKNPASGGGNSNAYADRMAKLDIIETDYRQRYLTLDPPANLRSQLAGEGWLRKFGSAHSHWELLRASALMAVVGQKINRFSGKEIGHRDDFMLSCDLESICFLKLNARPSLRPILVDASVLNQMKMRRVKVDLEQDAWWRATSAEDIDQTEAADKEEDDEVATQMDESDEDTSFHEAPEQPDPEMERLTQDVAESGLTTPKKKRRS